MRCTSCNKELYPRHLVGADKSLMCGPCAMVPTEHGDDVKSKSAVRHNLKKDLANKEPRREYKEFYPMLVIKSNFARNRTILLGGGADSIHFNGEGIATTPAHNLELVQALQRARPGRFTIISGGTGSVEVGGTTTGTTTGGSTTTTEGTQGGVAVETTATTTNTDTGTTTTTAAEGTGTGSDVGGTEVTTSGTDEGGDTTTTTTARQRRLAKAAQTKKSSKGGASSKNKSVEKST